MDRMAVFSLPIREQPSFHCKFNRRLNEIIIVHRLSTLNFHLLHNLIDYNLYKISAALKDSWDLHTIVIVFVISYRIADLRLNLAQL